MRNIHVYRICILSVGAYRVAGHYPVYWTRRILQKEHQRKTKRKRTVEGHEAMSVSLRRSKLQTRFRWSTSIRIVSMKAFIGWFDVILWCEKFSNFMIYIHIFVGKFYQNLRHLLYDERACVQYFQICERDSKFISFFLYRLSI